MSFIALKRPGDVDFPDADKPIWICDIDGTVALKGERRPFDWARVGEDAPNWPVILIVRALLLTGQQIVFVSGRSEECRQQTELWLDTNVYGLLRPQPLIMRPVGDFRPDTVLKREIYDTHLAGYTVIGVFDDRNSVVAMWRELGLACFQVAEGDF